NGNLFYDPTTSIALQQLSQGSSLDDTFVYQVTDLANQLPGTATVTVSVSGINDAPRTNVENINIQPDVTTLLRPLDDDSDIDGFILPSTMNITLEPARGSFVLRPDGTIVYSPFGNFTGSDQIRYTVEDNNGAVSPEGVINLSVNDLPVTEGETFTTFIGNAIEFNVLDNDMDTNGLDPNSVIFTDPERGEIVPLGNGNVRYIPNAIFTGVDTFTYTVADTLGGRSEPTNVTISIRGGQFQNPALRFDVSNDGLVSPIDPLLVINLLNGAGVASVPINEPFIAANTDDNGEPIFYYDVNADNRVTPLDALLVINELARLARDGELAGEQLAAGVTYASDGSIVSGINHVDEFDGVQLGGETEVSDAESLQRGAAALHYQSNGPSAD
ncbi:MAG: Ig-like domain-containing protein, partial [Planctomycetota bacterium]